MRNVCHSFDVIYIFIRLQMKCSIKLGFASLNRTFHLPPHENFCTIAPITIHYLYTSARVRVYSRRRARLVCPRIPFCP